MNLDQQIALAFAAWDKCHRALARHRAAYQAALRRHEQDAGPDPVALRDELLESQRSCDAHFAELIRLAEERSKDSYL